MSTSKFTLTLALALLVASGSAFAQETAQEAARQHHQRTAQQASSDQSQQSAKELSDYLAGKLMLMNQSIEQLSKMAEEKASSSEVQQFANTLAQSHSQFNSQLQQNNPQLANLVKLQSGTEHTTAFRGTEDLSSESRGEQSPGEQQRAGEQRIGQQQSAQQSGEQQIGQQQSEQRSGEQQITDPLAQERSGTESAQRSESSDKSTVHKILKLDQKAAQNYIEMSKQMLDRHDGQDFDMGYLGLQIGMHTWALSQLEAISSANVDDQQIQQIAQQTRSKMKEHLDKAKELAKKFEDDRSSRQQQQPGG